LGVAQKADQPLLSALELRKSRFGPDHPQVVESLIELSLLRFEQGKLDEAEQLIRTQD
jgi:hypothetical protein